MHFGGQNRIVKNPTLTSKKDTCIIYLQFWAFEAIVDQ